MIDLQISGTPTGCLAGDCGSCPGWFFTVSADRAHDCDCSCHEPDIGALDEMDDMAEQHGDWIREQNRGIGEAFLSAVTEQETK